MAEDWEAGDDQTDDVAVDPKKLKSSKGWLALIKEAQKVFAPYHDKADNIDKQYANLERLGSTGRDRQMQMFWANIQVLGPSVYSRPPVPVVVPRFRDRRPLVRTASELLERSTVVSFELESIDEVMKQVRDDLVVQARGCVWLRYEGKSDSRDKSEHVCIDFINRKDFVHEAARTWKEVDWVARRGWMTRKEMKKRFSSNSGKAYQDAAFEKRKDENGDDDGRLKAAVWEIWSKSENRVVWVTEGVEKLLDDDNPHLSLEGFFPCPRPAYATVQRGSLIPVPDMLFYKDQLEEINELTARIGSLTDAVKLRGFYPAGVGEIGDAVEAAVKNEADNMVLIPVSNWTLMGSVGAKDMIVWLPLREVVEAITGLLAMRKELIEDIYQITGLSDIMRGSTVASETLGAQQLKSQYGSVRVKDKQEELVRLARDTTRIMAEIMAENFSSDTLLNMSQMEIETNADIAKQTKPLKAHIADIERQLKEAQRDPEVAAMAQQQPEKAQQVMQQAQQQIGGLQGQIAELEEKPTVEDVMKLLRDERVRPFALDIETDSTITPDENAQKQRATEFVTAVGGFLGQALPLIKDVPEAMPLAGQMLKFVASQFRAGRELDGDVDEFVDKMKARAGQPMPPDPAHAKAQAETQALQADMQAKIQDRQAQQQEKMQAAQMKEAEAQAAQGREDQRLHADLMAKQAEDQRKITESNLRIQQMQADDTRAAEKHAQDMQMGALKLQTMQMEIAAVQAASQIEETSEVRPPSESISYKDIPPEAQSQMLAQAGIVVSPQELAAHAQQAVDQAMKAKAAAKPAGPA